MSEETERILDETDAMLVEIAARLDRREERIRRERETGTLPIQRITSLEAEVRRLKSECSAIDAKLDQILARLLTES